MTLDVVFAAALGAALAGWFGIASEWRRRGAERGGAEPVLAGGSMESNSVENSTSPSAP